MKTKNIELLSPAGNMESFYSALNGGANAIYLGGKNFNARSSANNFTNEEIEEIVKIATLRDVKIFLTVNTLFKEEELKDLITFLDKMYNIGIYAFIIQDIGLAKLIKNRYPKIYLHASTQLSAHSLGDVKYLEELGFDRIVLARETSLEEMTLIRKNTKVELEVFIHGALCVSYSGQCLMSSMIGGRSGNRGKCAQPCRMSYNLYHEKNKTEAILKGYLLSPQDINSLKNVGNLIEAGITSLKIEGRMKSPEYVYGTTSSYRKKIDETYSNIITNDEDVKKNLLTLFNRGGKLSDGYLSSYSGVALMSNVTPKSSGTYLGVVTDYNKVSGKCVIKLKDSVTPGDGLEVWTTSKPHVGCGISQEKKSGENLLVKINGDIKVGDDVYKSYNKKLIDELATKYKKLLRKSNVFCNVSAKTNEPFTFTFMKDDIAIKKVGDNVEVATNKALNQDDILDKLSKTGATPFNIIFNKIDIDENIFLSIGRINILRREACEELEKMIIDSIPRKNTYYEYDQTSYSEKKLALSVFSQNINHIDDILKCKIKRLYLPLSDKLVDNIDTIADKCLEKSVDLFISLPSITHSDDEEILITYIDKLKEKKFKGYLVSNYGQINLVDREIILDYNFNVYNSYSRDRLLELDKVSNVTLSPELNLKELISIGCECGEIIVHGRQPIMETRQCPVGLYVSKKDLKKFCSKKNKDNNYFLRDKKECDFPIITNCNICNATILNSQMLFMLDKYNDLKKLNGTLRITIDDKDSPYKIIKAYENVILNNQYDDVFNIKENYENNITKGHFYRGVL